MGPAGAGAVTFQLMSSDSAPGLRSSLLIGNSPLKGLFPAVGALWDHSQGKSKPLDSTLNWWWMGSWEINAPVPLSVSWNNSVSQHAKQPSCLSSNLLTQFSLASFPSLSHFFTPYKCFPRITYKINSSHSNPSHSLLPGNLNYDTYQKHPSNYWKIYLLPGNDNPLQYSCLKNLHWQRSFASYSPWCHKKSDTAEVT